MPLPESVCSSEPFASMSEQARSDFAGAVALQRHEAGATIYDADQESAGMYVLVSGTVQLDDPQMTTIGGDRPQSFSTPGTLISKGSLLDPFRHRHRCSAETDAEVMVLTREAFGRLFEDKSPAAFALVDHLVREISGEVRELNSAIHQLLSEH